MIFNINYCQILKTYRKSFLIKHTNFAEQILANIELNRPICRRVGKLERNGWMAIGTETEAERQELSGGKHQGRQQL